MKEFSADMLNARGKPFGELIREYRRRRGMSQEQLGAVAHVKKNAVGAWEAGRSRPDVSCIPALCRALGMPLEVFFGISGKTGDDEITEKYSRLNDYNRQVVLKQMDLLYDLQGSAAPAAEKTVRVFRSDLSAAAGPVSYIGETSGETVLVREDETTRRADEIIRVSGDSMEPTFYDGDQVFVQHTDSLREGEIGIFIHGHAGYIKEYRRDGLYSHNPAYPPIRFSENDSVQCFGRVLGVYRPSGSADGSGGTGADE